MDRPVQWVGSFGGLLILGSVIAIGEEAPAAAKRERVISPRVAEILSAAAPRFTPPAPTSGGPIVGSAPSPAARARLGSGPQVPANTIIRLPEYVVTERKPRPLPKYEEVISPRELEKLAMREFLGPEDGFDRGFLNVITVPQLWKMIPLLGKIPLAGFMTNEERAMGMYRADREAKAWAESMSLLTPRERAAISRPTGSAPPK
jgi:hypothetical protein